MNNDGNDQTINWNMSHVDRNMTRWNKSGGMRSLVIQIGYSKPGFKDLMWFSFQL